MSCVKRKRKDLIQCRKSINKSQVRFTETQEWKILEDIFLGSPMEYLAVPCPEFVQVLVISVIQQKRPRN